MEGYKQAGILSPVIAFISILLAVSTHSWFSFEKNAISDLGRVGLEYNYILNYGLILSGLFGLVFAYGLIKSQKRVLGRLGSFIFAAGIFSLLLIGVFPEGTPPHLSVSLGFFLLSGFGMLLKGIDDLKEKREFGIFTIILFSLGWILAVWALKTFKGVAIAELIGAIAVSIWVYSIIFWRDGFK
jgi:hypothetical membrane protein